MERNFLNEETKPDIFEYLASLNDKELMTNFYSDTSCCICTFRFLHPISQGIIYKMLFCKRPITLKIMRKWPEAKNDEAMNQFEVQFDKLFRLQILFKNKNDECTLNSIFAENIKVAISTDHELSLIKAKTTVEKKAPTQEELTEHAKAKLQKIIFFMLNLLPIGEMNEFVIKLLLESNFIEETHSGMSLTVDGFRFILEDISSQIHILLLNYIKMKKSSPHTLQLIFQLIMSSESSYKINESTNVDNQMIINILMELKQIGLVYLKKMKRFYVTRLMRSFLFGDDIISASRSLMSQDEDKSIIVETNFRVYCYTSSGLYRAILQLFCKIDVIFPNFIGGIITRERVREAFKKGITAEQISMFLNKHAHEQMYIKKDLEDEKEDPAGILVDPRDAAPVGVKKADKRISKSASVIPKNVKDQMSIWESEMKCLQRRPGLMIDNFENRDKYDQFKAFLKSSSIMPLDWNEKNMTVVVALDKEKEIYEFLNRH